MNSETNFTKTTKRNLAIVVLALLVIAPVVRCQHHSPPYTGALLYSQPWIETVPPVYPGQASEVTTAYFLFDMGLRLSNFNAPIEFFNRMTYGDTSKYIANLVYRVCDDNPVLYSQWLAEEVKPEPYHTDPGRALYSFQERLAKICPDTARTWMLVSSDMILHVHVVDTVIVPKVLYRYRPNGNVRVTAQIIDAIKGKYVPACPPALEVGKGGFKTLSVISPDPTYPVQSSPGTCIQFEYALGWGRGPGNDDMGGDKMLFDSVNGSWIKPGNDYIVFLKFYGVGSDSANHFVSVWPVTSFGTNAGMYPINSSGSVSDPDDDFGMGASAGLSAEAWKARLRARIQRLINP